MQKPQGDHEGKCLVQIPGGVRGGGGMVMDEIDTCITVHGACTSLMQTFENDNKALKASTIHIVQKQMDLWLFHQLEC